MLTAAWHMLRDGLVYQDLEDDHLERRDKSKAVARLLCRLQDL